MFVGGGICNGRGLGPGLEAGPSLEKRGSPRGLLQLASWSLLVVCGCWSQNGAALFQFILLLSWVEQVVPAQLFVLYVWLELPYK